MSYSYCDGYGCFNLITTPLFSVSVMISIIPAVSVMIRLGTAFVSISLPPSCDFDIQYLRRIVRKLFTSVSYLYEFL